LEKHVLTSGKHLFISAIDGISRVLPDGCSVDLSDSLRYKKNPNGETIQHLARQFAIKTLIQ
jgi:hypothetical protein